MTEPQRSCGPAGGEQPDERPKLVRRIEARRLEYRQRGLAYRAAWVTAAFIVLLAGLAMVVLPGPALVVVPLGLAMLSLQFAWAENLLEEAITRATKAGQSASQMSRRRQILSAAAIVCGVAAAAAVAYAILLR